MAAYEYTCLKDCGGSVMVFAKLDENRPRWKKCPKCGGRCLREYRPSQLDIRKPRVTADITGTEVEITSKRQEEELLERHGKYRLLSTDMPGDRASVQKRKKKRFEENIKSLGNIEEQYQKKTAVSVTSGV